MSAAPATTSATVQAVVAAGAVPDSVTVSVADARIASVASTTSRVEPVARPTATTLYALRSRA